MRRQQNNVRIPIEQDLELWAARRNNKSRRAQERSKEQAKRERREDREDEEEHD